MSKNIRVTKVPEMGSVENEKRSQPTQSNNTFYGNTPEIKINRTLKPVALENATLEAERGETVITNLQGEGIPEFYTVGGKPHSKGGTPLDLPENSFFFSKNNKLKIRDPELLDLFGKTGKAAKKGFLPSELSKQYDLNKYREILANPFSDKLSIETAEMMIKNYNLKLGSLALAQESLKGFEKGIPDAALAYMEAMNLEEKDLMPQQEQDPQGLPQFKNGGSAGTNKRRVKITGLPQQKKRVRVTGLPQYEKAGNVGGKRKQKLTSGVNKWDPTKEGFKPEWVKEGDYVLQTAEDGTRYYQTYGGKGRKKYEGELIEDENLGDYREYYSLLRDKLEDPEILKAMQAATIAQLENTKATSHMTQADIDEAIKLTKDPESFKKNFLRNQQANYGIVNKTNGNTEGYSKWDHDSNAANAYGKTLGYDDFSTAQTTAFQAASAGVTDLKNDKKTSKAFSDFTQEQAGPVSETQGIAGNKRISKIDGFRGNNTAGQIMVPREDKDLYTDVEWENIPEEKKTKHFQQVRANADNPFWLQDVNDAIGKGVVDWATVKKATPWNAPIQTARANPTFKTADGTISHLQAGAAALAEKAGMYGGPQATAAINAGIQRGLLPGIFQAQESAQGFNAQTSNEFEKFNTGLAVKDGVLQANRSTGLYDKYTIAEQQYENAKRAARHNLIGYTNNMFTNRGKTQTMNSMYPQYHVDPASGGYTYHTGVNPKLHGNKKNQSAVSDRAFLLKEAYSDMTWEEARKMAEADAGIPQNNGLPANVNPAAYNYPGGSQGR